MNPTAYVGIDPGITGSVCEISPAGTVRFHDVPTIARAVRVGKTNKTVNRKEYDDAGMAQVIRAIRDGYRAVGVDVMVTLEKVNAMPARDAAGNAVAIGATSMFNFGCGYGLWRGILAGLELRQRRVSPVTWKAALLKDVGRDHGAAASVATQLYPAAATLIRGPKGGLMKDRVAALLIAHWGTIQTG